MSLVAPGDRLILILYISFNKKREDFPDSKRYNDYLEEVEDISALFPQMLSVRAGG